MKLIKTFKEFINEGVYLDKKTGLAVLSRKNLSVDDENYNDEVLKTVYPHKDVAYMQTIYYGLSGEHYDMKNRDHIARSKYTMDKLKQGHIKDKEKALDDFIKPMAAKIRLTAANNVLNYVFVLGSRQPLAEDIGKAFQRNFFQEGKDDIVTKTKRPNTPQLVVLNKIEYPDPADIINWEHLHRALLKEQKGKSLDIVIGFLVGMIDRDKTSPVIIQKIKSLFNEHAPKKERAKASIELKNLIKDMRYKAHNRQDRNYDPRLIIHWKHDKFPLVISKSGDMPGNISQFFNTKYNSSTLEFMKAIQMCATQHASMLMVDDNMHSRKDMKHMMKFAVALAKKYRDDFEGQLHKSNWREKIFGYALYRIGVESDEVKQLRDKLKAEKDKKEKERIRKEEISPLEDIPSGEMTGKKAALNMADFEKYLAGKKVPILRDETGEVKTTYPKFHKNLGKFVEPRLDYLDQMPS